MTDSEPVTLREEIVNVHKSIALLSPLIVVLYTTVGGLPVKLGLLSSVATVSVMSAVALACIAALAYGVIDTAASPYNTDE